MAQEKVRRMKTMEAVEDKGCGRSDHKEQEEDQEYAFHQEL